MKIVILTGKGGVGKTSLAAATAISLAKHNKVIVLSIDDAHSLSDAFNLKMNDGKVYPINKNLYGKEISPIKEGGKYIKSLNSYLREIIDSKYDQLEIEEALSFPSLSQLLSLLSILNIYEENEYDYMVIDCAPSAETLSILSLSEKLSTLSDRLLPMLRSFNKAVGGLIQKKTSVPKPKELVFDELRTLTDRLNILDEILHNPSITTIRVVTCPEKMVLKESMRTYNLIKLYDFNVDSIMINRIYPSNLPYFNKKLQDENLQLLKDYFKNLKIIEFPLLKKNPIGFNELSLLANNELIPIYPEAIKDEGLDIFDENIYKILRLKIQVSDENLLNIEKNERVLIIKLKSMTRFINLPDKIAFRIIDKIKCENGEVLIYFKRA